MRSPLTDANSSYLKAWLPFDNSPTEDKKGLLTWVESDTTIQSSSLQLGDQIISVDFWVQGDPNDSSTPAVFAIRTFDTDIPAFTIRLGANGYGVKFWFNNTADLSENNGGTFTGYASVTDKPHHIYCVLKPGFYLKLYIDGEFRVGTNSSKIPPAYIRQDCIVRLNDNIAQFRLYEGVELWAENFTPPLWGDYGVEEMPQQVTAATERRTVSITQPDSALISYLPFDSSDSYEGRRDVIRNTRWNGSGSTTDQNAVSGRAFKLDRSAYLSELEPFDASRKLTFDFWFWISYPYKNQCVLFVGKQNPDVLMFSLNTSAEDGKKLTFSYNRCADFSNVNCKDFAIDTDFTDKPHQVTIWYDPGVLLAVYIDGIQKVCDTEDIPFFNTYSCGRVEIHSGDIVYGTLDELRIYNGINIIPPPPWQLTVGTLRGGYLWQKL